MGGRETVGAILWISNSGSGNEDLPKFNKCVDRRDPQIHEVWNFGEDGVTPEVHPTAQVDVGTGFVGEFATKLTY